MRQTFSAGTVVQSRPAAAAGTTTTTGAPVRPDTWQNARPVFPADETWMTSPAPFSRRRRTVGCASSSLNEQVSIRPPRSGQ
ncbi:MAG: hypothetical protein BWX50_01336 [Euryarchaeota archaeon ADurb.Bin009]|nr:MAG: hypothetical protein BWX50_01336 [Euryarchaeota archaeon ADurb.Bin009]